MSLKPGDKVRCIDDDPVCKTTGLTRIGKTAVVIQTGVPGFESVKAKDEDGTIFYARPRWLRKLNQADTKKETAAVRKRAAVLTEKRMETLMKAQTTTETKPETKTATRKSAEKPASGDLPTFQEIADSFYNLALLGQATMANETESAARDACIALAERALHHRIKNGCQDL